MATKKKTEASLKAAYETAVRMRDDPSKTFAVRKKAARHAARAHAQLTTELQRLRTLHTTPKGSRR